MRKRAGWSAHSFFAVLLRAALSESKSAWPWPFPAMYDIGGRGAGAEHLSTEQQRCLLRDLEQLRSRSRSDETAG